LRLFLAFSTSSPKKEVPCRTNSREARFSEVRLTIGEPLADVRVDPDFPAVRAWRCLCCSERGWKRGPTGFTTSVPRGRSVPTPSVAPLRTRPPPFCHICRALTGSTAQTLCGCIHSPRSPLTAACVATGTTTLGLSIGQVAVAGQAGKFNQSSKAIEDHGMAQDVHNPSVIALSEAVERCLLRCFIPSASVVSRKTN
jgi:hypothetical protein